MQWDAAYTLFLLGITAITYYSALVIESKQAYGKKKYIITTGILLALLPLLIFKYYDFIHFQVGAVLSSFNIGTEMNGLNWAVPIGISFYTFQAIGYLWDVYYRRVKAEHNWWDYMLFVSFFPQILSGPISKAKDLLPQIKSVRTFDYVQAVEGCKWLMWGMFMKIVMADRISLVVDTIVPNYIYLSGKTCILGAVLYSLQIYGDFAGYSFMAVGVGKLLGFNLINNFERPYFAATVTEFWRRWHISLTKWLTDYVYIPLGGSRCSKPRTYCNIFITFIVSGIWHGANWTFVFWGTIHGIAQIFEKMFNIQKCKNPITRPFRIILTFIFVTIAWIFFRVETINDAFEIIAKIFTDTGDLVLDIPKSNYLMICSSIALVFVKEWLNEYKPDISIFNSKHLIIRWGAYVILLSWILLCGVFDSGTFIYVNF